MNYDYSSEYDSYSEDRMNEEIEIKMHGQKRNVLTKLSSKAVQMTEDFLTLLVYSYWEGLPTAERIVRELDLSKMDLLAMSDSFKEYKEELITENQYNYF